MSEITIRTGAPDDLERLTEIYNHYIRETAITFDVEPFSPAARRVWFEQFATTGRYRLLVAQEDDAIVGYAASVRFRPKPAYETSVELSIYLAAEATGRGIGTRLTTTLFERLASEDVHRVYGGVTLPNPASVGLLKKLGFQPVGVFREVGRKLGRYWDVEWFEKELHPQAPRAAP